MVVHVITVVPCGVPKTDGEMKPSTKLQELREALKKYGGEAVLPILYGDATVKTSPAMDPDQGPFDICITSHPSVQSYVIATESHLYQVAAKNTKILTFGFSNQT